ncbi:filamin-A-interacting protein 1-like isoform X2 [Thalassophryne amazonica]|uniref:filamin-A-interacting protein 1-like isoform X2 n=1 Tax=Thalassophryne amazonica TaxID=390379 RepID=UPI00147093BA|nr:filamin-A-interacting protein 1-like isoform X2 [Thalassophryne amazonica]
MRSKSNVVETSATGVLGVSQGDCNISHEQKVTLPMKNLKVKVQPSEGEEKVEVEVISDKEKLLLDSTEPGDKMGDILDLSKENVLKLLGIMEGEVQLERLQEKHRETYRRMLGQLLLAEKCHRRTVHELDTEKCKHADYMNKSDDFTNLLEQERERLKRLLEHEKAYQVRKEKEHAKRLAKLQEELVKLKSFALMLVTDRQQNLEQIDQQSQRVQELSQQLQQQDQALGEAGERAREDSHRLLSLESQLKEKSAEFTQRHEEMTAKLASQDLHNRQLNAKLLGLAQKVDELEESNGNLRKSEEELQELREKIGKGECGNSNLISELEVLRKQVLEMEGKDEEITKTESQCKELRKKLQEEDAKSKDLRLEVEKLQKRMVDLEKLEGPFSISKEECTQLNISLERERDVTKVLSDEVVALKIRMKELESSELRLEKSELSLKDDLSKLKSLTVTLMEERRTLMERLKLDEKKKEDLNKMVKAEQGKVMEVTERLIEESKKFFKLKSEMETKVETLTLEKVELSSKLAYEIDKTKDLNSTVGQMKKRLEAFEQSEKMSVKNLIKCEIGKIPESVKKEDNKIKELTFEIEHLKSRLKHLEVLEGDLIRTEDQYDLLERRFITEQDKANVLSQQVDEMRSQIARNKAVEKGEEKSHEDLRQQCKREEAKTRDLQVDVVALKEKIHELMHKEDQLSQLQVDYSVLQQRFLEEEEKAKNMSTEVFHLTKELEVTKRHSRVSRPSLNGRRMVNVGVTSTGVQTDPTSTGTAEEDTAAVFIHKSVQEENHIMNNIRQKCLKKPTERTPERCPSSSSDLGMKKSWIPWMRKKDNIHHETNLEKPLHMNGDHISSELTTPPKQGQPLHIRVTPDHQHSMTTVEITSSKAGDVFSAPLSPNPCHHKPKITIIPTHSAATPRVRTTTGPQGAERTKSPVTITTISRAKSPESRRVCSPTSGRPLSPLPMMTVSTATVPQASASPEPQEMTVGRAVFKVTPEKQMVPIPMRRSHNNTSIISTPDDSKIHIQLANTIQPKTVTRPVASLADSKEMTLSTGTVLRSPRQITTAATRSTASKVTSSITITTVTSTAPKATHGTMGHDAQSPRTGPTRIPMSKNLKTGKAALGSLGSSSGVKLEVRAESPSVRLDVKKPAVNSFQADGKS